MQFLNGDAVPKLGRAIPSLVALFNIISLWYLHLHYCFLQVKVWLYNHYVNR